MEDWDNFCSISKKARQILSNLEQPSAQVQVQEVVQRENWSNALEKNLILYERQLIGTLDQANKFCELVQILNHSKEGIMVTSKDLNTQCQKIIAERNHLVALNSAIQSKYFYYTHFESLDGHITILTRDPTALLKRFLDTFAQVEDAITFFYENSHYNEASFYRYEYETLLDDLTGALTEKLSENFHLFYAYYENYFKCLGNCQEIENIFKHLMISPANFVDTKEFTAEIIRQFYWIRNKYVGRVIDDALDKIKSEKMVVKQCEMACEVLERLWNKEKKLFVAHFSEEATQDQLKAFFLLYSEPVYEALRENLIQETNFERLCETSKLLKKYSFQGSAQIFSNLSQDVQERIIFTISSYLSEEITAFYTEEKIHPVVKKNLKVIKMLENTVNPEIFDNIVTEIITLTINSLKTSIKSEDFNEVHIFLIRNLLELRKDLETIGVCLKGSSYKELDFSDTKRLFWKFVMGEVSLKKKGVFAELVNSGVPKFNEKNENPLEKELSSACQSYILRTFHDICNPILAFISKSTVNSSIPYESAEKTLIESTKKVNSTFSQFSQHLFLTLDEKNYKEMTENVSMQILKAFNQLLTYMKQSFPDKPSPSIEDIESLLDSHMLLPS